MNTNQAETATSMGSCTDDLKKKIHHRATRVSVEGLRGAVEGSEIKEGKPQQKLMN